VRSYATPLAEHLEAERALAVRSLLANPLIDSEGDPDAFRLITRHGTWLADYFETACGWALTVDPASGYARLAKRAAAAADGTRPLRRTRGQSSPFDRRRYQLLCLVCAELVRHPVTTIGLLASAITSTAGLETGRYGERSAFVDALLVLRTWGALRATGGDVEAFLDDDRSNAILTADTGRLHRLIVSAAAPSTLPDHLATGDALAALLAEPRYQSATGGDVGGVSDEARNRWARHRLARQLLDGPVVYYEDLSPAEVDYAASLSGRRWLRQRVQEAGMELEERAEGMLAVDPDGISTDTRFPAPAGNAHQLALLLADRLIETTASGQRRLSRLEPDQLRAEVARIFDRFPGWARGQREEGGPERLAREAVDLLVSFGLAQREPDGSVMARPALARYRTAEPVVSPGPTLWED
jgi:uncharacterized protein (TIGR02678 family)